MTKITIFSSHRAERGLLQPLINRLEMHPEFDREVFSLHPSADFDINYAGAHNLLERNRPDLVIIPCDRLEALAAALAAFNMGIPIIHFHAGDVGTGSKDEMYRHAISIMADVHLCNGPTAKKTVNDLLTAVKRSPALVYDVGSTAMDDLEIDTSICPNRPYELVLYHPPTNDMELINRELDEIEELINPDTVTIWLSPNGDLGSDIIIRRANKSDAFYKTDLPRAKFLGLVQNCQYFIGNSSSMVCEAPMWLSPEQIIHVGDRNRNRSFDEIQPGATDRIMGILEVIASGPI
jgi:UDP-N-acetylglucosamine 2-epimerase